VQLFVQRALMGHEDDVTLSDEHSDAWVWMKRYRVWEANRKIFLYPENWVHAGAPRRQVPALPQARGRDLSVDDLGGVASKRPTSAISRGSTRSRVLRSAGTYHEVERTSKGEVVVDRLHVFGRTHDDPSKVFYRQRIDDAYWTPWEEVPFQIEARGVLPIMVNRRLVLIWPKFNMRPGDTEKQPKEGTAVSLVQVGLMWSERQRDGWSGVKTSRDVTVDPFLKVTGIEDARNRGIFAKFFLTSENKESGESIVRVARLHDQDVSIFYYPRGLQLRRPARYLSAP
jgi:hypothetical protein